MYWVTGLPLFPIQNVSVRAASGASRSSVVCTVAPSGTTAIAASAAATCASSWYVEPCQRLLSGNWKASATATAAIIAPPCRTAATWAEWTRSLTRPAGLSAAEAGALSTATRALASAATARWPRPPR